MCNPAPPRVEVDSSLSETDVQRLSRELADAIFKEQERQINLHRELLYRVSPFPGNFHEDE